MTIFFNFFLSFYSLTKHFHIHYLIVKKIHSKKLMTIFFLVILFHYKAFTQILFNCEKKSIAKHFIVILFLYKTFTQILFNCNKKYIAKNWRIPFSLSFYSITKHFHKRYLMVKKSIAKHLWLYPFIFSLSIYSFTKYLHIHYLIVKKNP